MADSPTVALEDLDAASQGAAPGTQRRGANNGAADGLYRCAAPGLVATLLSAAARPRLVPFAIVQQAGRAQEFGKPRAREAGVPKANGRQRSGRRLRNRL